MRYCRFMTEFGPQYGEIEDRPGDLAGGWWIERLLPPFEEDLCIRPFKGKFKPLPLDQAELLTPVVPSKILCIGRNYSAHAAELGNDIPSHPLVFMKPPSALLPPGGTIRLPRQSKRVDFEGELAVVIGRRASKIGAKEGIRKYIRGFTIVNDVTARDLQKADGQWTRSKGFDTFCPVGPVVTDEVNPSRGIGVITRLNGHIHQEGSTRDLIFPIDALLRYITSVMTLLPGDIIATGTPSGVGPMRHGDLVEVSVEGIGTLANRVTRA